MANDFSDFPTISSRPHPAIGFTVILNGTPSSLSKSQAALQRALAHFPDIQQRAFIIGNTALTVWGREPLDGSTHQLPDGSTLALIGSPSGNYSWEFIQEKLFTASPSQPFLLPWEGRVILIKIDPQGDTWTVWNDWVGSIPVFYARTASSRMASTLEPVVVDTLGFSREQFFLPSLVALLMWGHYFSNWTLFKNIHVLPPDCETTWDENGLRHTPLGSVIPTEINLHAGWDDLMEEMYVHSKNAIEDVLKEREQWVLPLSSGMDSRLIAGVAAEKGANVRAYTWGTPKSSDVIHARSIAHSLNIPWKYLKPGNSYLAANRQRWADIFGSSMHFHGMYQMPFLDGLRQEPQGTILSGFLGDCMAGYDVKFCGEVNRGKYPYQITPDGYMHWTINELQELMSVPIQETFSVLANEFERQLALIPGPQYLKLRFSVIWGRQRHFTYFQSMMSDYWQGVATPYINRAYARFAFSLPRAVLDERILQRMMLVRYYPKLASIPGTYSYEPALLTGSYLLKKRIRRHLPENIARVVQPGMFRTRSNADVACVRHDGKASFYPLFEALSTLSPWMNIEKINETYNKILARNDTNAIRKLQSIQTLAYRLHERSKLSAQV